MTLETREERVRLLKVGIQGKQIEQLYIKWNGFRIVNNNTLQEEICTLTR